MHDLEVPCDWGPSWDGREDRLRELPAGARSRGRLARARALAYVGLPEAVAMTEAHAAGLRARVGWRDGVGLPRRASLAYERVNFHVVDGLVTDVSIG